MSKKFRKSDIEWQNNHLFDEYLTKFHAYLNQQRLRITYERNLVLHCVYLMEEHFTIDSLQEYLHERKQHVSTSTLYKALSIMEEAQLIVKHQFSTQKVPQYEKIHNRKPHNHIYMEDTDTVMDFSDKRINEIIKDIEKKYNISSLGYSFTVYCNHHKKESITNIKD